MSDNPRRRGPYAKSAGVRETIVQAATEVFAESGFRSATMKDIAARAGISERGLAHHFASKERLLSEVLTARNAESALLLRHGPPRDVLRSVVDIMADNARRPRLVELHSVLFAEATATEHPAHAHHAKRLDTWRAYLTTLFRELQKEGVLAPGVTAELAATTMVAIQDGIQIQWLYDPTIDMVGVLEAFIATVAPGIGFAGAASSSADPRAVQARL